MKTMIALLFAVVLQADVLAQQPQATLYDALGGKPGVHHIVTELIRLVQVDPRTSESFKDIDLKNLSMRLQEQICELSGGPCVYKGKSMAVIHDGLNITQAQFNAVAEALQQAMDAAKVPSSAQNRLIAKLAPMHKDVVTK